MLPPPPPPPLTVQASYGPGGDLSMLISIGYMCLMLCAPLDWQYAELPSSASDAVLCSVLVRKMWDI